MKSLKIKNVLKNTIFPVVTLLNRVIPKNNKRVLLYIPNKRFVYSLGPLKQYLIENGFDKKYNISYGYEDLKSLGSGKWVEKLAMVKSMLTFLISRHVFYTSGQIPIKPSKSQIVIHLHHGNAHFKPLGKLSNVDNGDEFFFTYMIASSDLFVPIMANKPFSK